MTRAALRERGSTIRRDGARAACDALRKGGKKARVARKAQNLWHLSLLRIVRDAKPALPCPSSLSLSLSENEFGRCRRRRGRKTFSRRPTGPTDSNVECIFRGSSTLLCPAQVGRMDN